MTSASSACCTGSAGRATPTCSRVSFPSCTTRASPERTSSACWSITRAAHSPATPDGLEALRLHKQELDRLSFPFGGDGLLLSARPASAQAGTRPVVLSLRGWGGCCSACTVLRLHKQELDRLSFPFGGDGLLLSARAGVCTSRTRPVVFPSGT